MSAAATAAGYLYASGRLRGRAAKEGQETNAEERAQAPAQAARRRPLRVTALPEPATESQPGAAAAPQARPDARTKPAPKIQYRTRRWRPDAA
jgi:hypothetical protein